MDTSVSWPTAIHQQAAEAIVGFFRVQAQIDAVLLVNSCARGRATPESDLDLAVLVPPGTLDAEQAILEQRWQEYSATQPIFAQLRQLGRFTGVHLDLFDGQFVPPVWDDGGGCDGFELEIGNRVAYSLPLWQGSAALHTLRATWLPYYPEPLRQERLAMVRAACHYDLEHVPFYVGRGLYFQAFDRFYKSFQEFLQALFIARRVYPLAYNKWIYEQLVERLGLVDLYAQLPPLLQITHFESAELATKADLLTQLLEQWT